ncbi:MAG: NUDIX domain-containing protein [bacterium]|nr:NUDIX domain-containing protein [bacterium]
MAAANSKKSANKKSQSTSAASRAAQKNKAKAKKTTSTPKKADQTRAKAANTRASASKSTLKKSAAPKNKPAKMAKTGSVKKSAKSNPAAQKATSKKAAPKSPSKTPVTKKGAVPKAVSNQKKTSKPSPVKKTKVKDVRKPETKKSPKPAAKSPVKTVKKSPAAVKASTKKVVRPSIKIRPAGPKHPSRETEKPRFPETTWGSGSKIFFEPTEHLPPPDLTCISGGFVFHGDKLVLANIPGRGWEIIGGRIDIGESPEDTFRREASRQIGVSLSHVKMLGIIRIEHTGPEPPNCPYPYPVGYGVQFIGIVEELLPFHGSDDSLGRSLISPEGVKEHYFEWNAHAEAVFEYAYTVYKKLKKKLNL